MKLAKYLLALLLVVSASGLTPLVSVLAASPVPRIESVQTPEVQRLKPVTRPITPTTPAPPPPAQKTTLGPNLILNPGVEQAGSNANLPANWARGGYGYNNRAFSYPVSGYNSSKAISVSITGYAGGDAKWYFNDVAVTSGEQYQFSDYYLSNVSSILTARFRLSNGSYIYKDLTTVGPQSSFTKAEVQFVIPSDVTSMTIFHLINQAGSLTTDEFSLNKITVSPPSNNLILNPGFEQLGTGGLPASWLKGGWGNNNRSYSYPVTGADGSKAARVTISNYVSGDAKWYFAPVAVTPGNYTYSDQYSSNRESIITAQFTNQNGTITYKDLGRVPAASNFTPASFVFSVPSGVNKVSIFHLIAGVGSLTIDNASLVPTTPTGIFATGAVSLRFDDGWLSQYQTAIPKLNSAGLEGTFYIITHQLADDGYPEFMSRAQLTNIYNAGHEIGAHTQTHPYLSQLTPTEQETEIVGSRQDLLSWNFGPVKSFAYPFGDYDATTLSIVENAGFSSAAATLDGFVGLGSDRYQLEREPAEGSVTFAQVKQWIDSAATNKQWLVLTFHNIVAGGAPYTTSPQLFNQIVDYLVQKQIPVVTISQGAESLQ